MKNFPGTSRRSATISTILRIPDRSIGNRSIVVSMIMFLTPRPENRCSSTSVRRLSQKQRTSISSAFCCVTVVFYASMHRITSITRKRPVRRSIVVSVDLEGVLRNWSSTRTQCLSPVKPMVKSSRPGPLKISVQNRISGSGCVIRRTRKARDLSKTLLGS